jgi:single-strand DNA-binding protein
MQELNLIGHLGKDAEIKGGNGKEFSAFSVAVTERWKDKDDVQQEKTTWYDCISNKTGVAKYMKKGSKVFVRGNLKASIYQNKDKEHLVSLSVNVNMIELLDSKEKEN